MSDVERLPDGRIIDLLQGSRQGPSGGEAFNRAFGELVRRYKGAIVTYLARYVGDLKTAEDLAQETFVRVFRKIDAYDSRARFSTWLYTIASNLAKDEFKRRKRHPALSFDWQSSGTDDTTRSIPTLEDAQESPERVALQTETSQRVQETLQRIEADDREILILREIQGLKYDEVAEILGVPLGTVKSRIARARVAFKNLWEQGQP
jgi:RNA polymerase sigma-70 factor (ECF subfamily)